MGRSKTIAEKKAAIAELVPSFEAKIEELNHYLSLGIKAEYLCKF